MFDTVFDEMIPNVDVKCPLYSDHIHIPDNLNVYEAFSYDFLENFSEPERYAIYYSYFVSCTWSSFAVALAILVKTAILLWKHHSLHPLPMIASKKISPRWLL